MIKLFEEFSDDMPYWICDNDEYGRYISPNGSKYNPLHFNESEVSILEKVGFEPTFRAAYRILWDTKTIFLSKCVDDWYFINEYLWGSPEIHYKCAI